MSALKLKFGSARFWAQKQAKYMVYSDLLALLHTHCEMSAIQSEYLLSLFNKSAPPAVHSCVHTDRHTDNLFFKMTIFHLFTATVPSVHKTLI